MSNLSRVMVSQPLRVRDCKKKKETCGSHGNNIASPKTKKEF